MPTPTTSTPGRAGVERAGVADAPLAEAAAQQADDVVARHAGRLVDDGEAVHGRRAGAGPRRSAAVGRDRSRAQDVVDALGGADDVVRAEVQDRRLLGLDLPVDRRLDAPAVALEGLEDRASPSSPESESK